MTANDNIKKDELTKMLKDSSILVIEGQNLSHLNLGTIDFTGRTFKDCNISDANFGGCLGLPKIENCIVDSEKCSDVVVVKSKAGNLTIFSMIRGNNPYYVINGKEYAPLSIESSMVAHVRRLASMIK